MAFPVLIYGWESWTIQEAKHGIIDAFELCRWIRLLRVPWTARRSKQSIPKEINPEYSLEGLMLKLQYFGHLMRRADSLEKTDAGKDWGQEEREITEDEMVGWHHWLNGHEFEQTPGDGEGQGSLACCSPWGHKELDMTVTEQQEIWRTGWCGEKPPQPSIHLVSEVLWGKVVDTNQHMSHLL